MTNIVVVYQSANIIIQSEIITIHHVYYTQNIGKQFALMPIFSAIYIPDYIYNWWLMHPNVKNTHNIIPSYTSAVQLTMTNIVVSQSANIIILSKIITTHHNL